MMSDVVEDDVNESQEENTSTVLPGQKLKKARENRNLGQEDIAKELKLDLRFVKALEEGRLNELPQPVYTAGYVRAYSKLVGLLPDEIVSEYSSYQKASTPSNTKTKKEKEQIPSHYRAVQTDLPKSFSVGSSQNEDKRKFNLLISLLAIVVVFAIIWHFSDKSSDPVISETTPGSNAESNTKNGASTGAEDGAADKKIIDLELPSPKSQTDENGLNQNKEQNVKLNQTSESEDKEIVNELVKNADKLTELSLHYNEDSWVDIRDATGKSIIRRLGVAGRSNTVSGIAPFEVLLGYSPGVSIEYDGKPFDMSEHSKKRVARFVIDEEAALAEEKATAQQNDNGGSAQGSSLPEDF